MESRGALSGSGSAARAGGAICGFDSVAEGDRLLDGERHASRSRGARRRLRELHGEFGNLREPARRRNDIGLFRMDHPARGEGARGAPSNTMVPRSIMTTRDHLVGELVDAVFDHDDCRAVLPVEASQHGEDLRHAGGIEIGGRLVENEKARARRQNGGDANALLLAAGELEDRAVAEIAEPDEVQRFLPAGP